MFSREIKLMKKQPTRYIVFIAVLIAMSLVFMLFLHFPILPAYSFLKMDFADVPVAFAGLMFGPVSAVIVAVLKVALYLLVKGTDSACIGELSNVICALAFGLSVSLIYHSKRNVLTLCLAFIGGVLIEVTVSVFSNWFIILPLYVKAGFFPAVAVTTKLLFSGIMAFNFIKFGLQATIGFMLFKSLEKALPFKTVKKTAAPPPENGTADIGGDAQDNEPGVRNPQD